MGEEEQKTKSIIDDKNLSPLLIGVPKETDDKDVMGRPRVVTVKTLELLRQGFMAGLTDKLACIFAGIAEKTLYNYQNSHPDFLQLKEDWKNNPEIKAKITVYNSLNRASTARWWLKHKKKEEFNTRVEIGGLDGKPIEIKSLGKLDERKRNGALQLLSRLREEFGAKTKQG